MKISKIVIDSMYGIEHLELDGKSVELVGKKGAGKTSVIDSIKLALTNQSEREYIIKQGASEGQILIQTDTGINIDRKKRTEKSDVNKVTENGNIVQAPQGFINDIFTTLQLNPVEFVSWDKKTQNRAILDLIEFKWDLDWIKTQFGELPPEINYSQHILQILEDIQAKDSYYWQKRADANKKELYKRQQIEDMALKFPTGYNAENWKKYDLQSKIVELSSINKANGDIERAKAYKKSYDDKLRGLEAETQIEISTAEKVISVERESLEKDIERLKAEITLREQSLSTLQEKLQAKKDVIQANYEIQKGEIEHTFSVASQYADKEIINTAELQEEINTATEMIKFISEFDSMLLMKNECEVLIEESQHYDRLINIARELPGTVLESCQLPIQGLSVKDGIPLVNGLPISNLSDGEKIDLCIDLALAQDKTGKLEMILLNGAEALDEISRQNIYEKCKNKGVQIIAARTTNDNEFNIVEL